MDNFARNINLFIVNWAGMPFLRLFFLSLAALVLVATCVAIWNRRIRPLSALIVIVSSIVLLAVAVYPDLIKLFIQIEYINRVRFAIGFLSLIVLVITFEALRMTKMQERYALLWVTTGVIILFFALFPEIVYMIGKLTGMEYANAIVAVIITFLLLVAFHFSVAMSQFQNHQAALAQQQAVLKNRIEVLEEKLGVNLPEHYVRQSLDSKNACPVNATEEVDLVSSVRIQKAVRYSSILIVISAVILILGVGLSTPSPMIGDEVTHYFMLRSQIERLPSPSIIAEIPLGTGGVEVRYYPHVFMWHYLGAIVSKFTTGGIWSVQIYHTLYLIQLLVFGYLTVRCRNKGASIAPLVYLLTIISIPMLLIFSVAFYQDIPLAAQILTACYFLQRRRSLIATFFICFAMTLKVTAILFLPAFIFFVFWIECKEKNWIGMVLKGGVVLLLLTLTVWFNAWALDKYGDTPYYPVKKAIEIVENIRQSKEPQAGDISSGHDTAGASVVSRYEVEIIANHPGDLRNPENFLIYGGILIWVLMLAGTILFVVDKLSQTSLCILRERPINPFLPPWWLWAMGGTFIILSYIFLQTSPDARFFLPGLILVLIPISEFVACIPHKKKWIPIFIAIALIQCGLVTNKVYTLRKVSPEIIEAVNFLKKNKQISKIFMYPEGNYRLFSKKHDWYLDYKLRQFWRGNNDFRIKLLNELSVNAIVIKKHLVASVSDAIINLGVYPSYFVEDIEKDSRFQKIFDNEGVSIYLVPND